MPSVVSWFEYAIYWIVMLTIAVFAFGSAIVNMFRKHK